MGQKRSHLPTPKLNAMQRLIVAKSENLRGTVAVPGDKSISHRAALLGAMAEGETVARGFLMADDCLRTLAAVEALGCQVRREADLVVVHSHGYPAWRRPADVLDLGNSGTTMRLLLGALAGRPFTATLDGDESLRRRPMDRVAVPLGMMGARVEGRGERCLPPVTITGGPLRAIEYEMPVASAQVKSAILLAGLQATGMTTVIEPAPSRDHTERMLRFFGATVLRAYPRVSISGPQNLTGCEFNVPGDISSAAYFVAAALLAPGSEVVIEGVGVNPTRTGFLDILEMMGAQVEVMNERSDGEPIADLRVTAAELRGAEVGGELIPRAIDELPLVAVLATQADGETVVRDAAELRVKESDRIAAMARGLRAMGAEIEERDDGWLIRGPKRLSGARIDAALDHRVAMSFAVAGLVAEGETIIDGAEAVATSFPDFAERLSSIGAQVKHE